MYTQPALWIDAKRWAITTMVILPDEASLWVLEVSFLMRCPANWLLYQKTTNLAYVFNTSPGQASGASRQRHPRLLQPEYSRILTGYKHRS